MSNSPMVQHPLAQETSHAYSTPSFREMVYEVSLKTTARNDWLGNIHGAHRLLQTLLQGQFMGVYQLLDFIIQPGGLFARITLGNGSTLYDFLKWVKEQSSPARVASDDYWDDELQWIKLIPPDRLQESTRSFLQMADRLNREARQSRGDSPHLFFYFRDQRFIQ